MSRGDLPPLTRRDFLRRACGCTSGVAALCLLPALTGCGRGETFDGLVIPLENIPQGRSIHFDGEHPVEVRRRDGVVTARSLFCTHQGCVVRWEEGADRYVCPCHDGVYDGEGRPLIGPPPRPLRELRAEVEKGLVLIHTRAPVEPA